ncbi:MAG: XkdX family protein [Synergistaceae bacterium]|nr:XkdX family protein [Synergistaceae bacterium]
MNVKFETIKKYYDLGLWTVEEVRKAVEKNLITAAEFKTITGQKY